MNITGNGIIKLSSTVNIFVYKLRVSEWFNGKNIKTF
jgi:hypothetical protein